MQLVPAATYPTQILQLLGGARKRIVIATMILLEGPQVHEILQLTLQAAQRGVQVTVLYDPFSFWPSSRLPQIAPAEFDRRVARTREFLSGLETAGGRVVQIGERALNPFAGRYHAKYTVVDDHVFSFGGVNMSDESFGSADFMLAAQDAVLAKWLEGLSHQSAQGELSQDINHPLPSGDIVFFDTGGKRKSAIYEAAVELTQAAQEIIYVSQHAPSGRLARAIQRKPYVCYTNRPAQMGRLPAALQRFDIARYQIKNSYQREQYIHAKCLLVTLPDGSHRVLSGSHNFSYLGVAFGTQEIALLSQSETLYQHVFQYVSKELQ